MNELATQAANGSLQSEDRGYIQMEVNQLVSEIDRVATTTTFNERKLLNGSLKEGVALQVGAEGTASNTITIKIVSLTAKGLKVSGLKVSGKKGTTAQKAMGKIKAAIKILNEQRATIGAVQNRLEHTVNNLNNVVENTTAAESQIRDTDMATEMVKYSNSNILQQAGQSMLAQSNQSNQGVLSLLG